MSGAKICAFPSRRASPNGSTGRMVRKLTRRAKYILAELDSGETLVIHLGMSGRMSVYAEGRQQRLGDYVYNPAPDGAGQGKHDHVVLETDAPARIVFNDHRRFGLMTLIPTEGSERRQIVQGHRHRAFVRCLQRRYLAAALAGKKTPIKSALLDQRVVAGLGNIYVCEALFLAHISPKRLAGAVKKEQIAALVAGHQNGSEGRDRGRRLDLARPCPGDRRPRQFPASLPGLWTGGKALQGSGIGQQSGRPEERLPRNREAHRPGRALDFLLPGCQK